MAFQLALYNALARNPKASTLKPKFYTIQMAFQLAHYNMYGESAATYESANQSAYKHGRTETIRSCTSESHKMCQTFCDNNGSASQADKVAALTAAVKQHGKITKNALMGKGWDRHMFALKYEALQNGMPLPSIYEDKAYKVTLSHLANFCTWKCVFDFFFSPRPLRCVLNFCSPPSIHVFGALFTLHPLDFSARAFVARDM
jgi:hypothetical protein